MRNKSIANMAALAAMMGLAGGPLRIPNFPGAGLPRRFPTTPRWFGVPLDTPLETPSCDPSRHNSRRYDQVQRDRKRRIKLNRATYKRYRRSTAEKGQKR